RTSASSPGAYAVATRTGETASPRARISSLAGPLTAAPPTIGLTPTMRARVAARPSATPGTASTGPTEVTGLDGHTTTTSASRTASRTPGAGRARAAPAYSTSSTWTCAFSRTKYSWNESQPSGVRTRVRTGSLLIGRMRVATPRRRASSAVTAVSVAPARRARVRKTCVARSRSPRLNHVSAPRSPIASRQRNVSPARPQPRAASSRPASAYITVSRSGETWRPQISASSPVLPITVSELRGTAPARPRRSFAAPVPPAIAVRRMSRGRGFPQGPEGAAAAPRVESGARRAGEVGGQRALRHRDKAVANPHAVEALRPGEYRRDAGRRRVIEESRHE